MAFDWSRWTTSPPSEQAKDSAEALGNDPVTATQGGYLAPADMPESWRELYEERAAIREYDGGQAREHAEAEALREILAMMQDDAPE